VRMLSEEVYTPTDESGRPIMDEAPVNWHSYGDGLERAVVFEPGFNTGNRNYGRSSMKIRFLLRGDKGAAQFLLGTDWTPGFDTTKLGLGASGWDVGYHAVRPQYEGQSEMDCEYLPGGKCFYDGSGLAAAELMERFFAEGENAVWRELEARYSWIEVDA